MVSAVSLKYFYLLKKTVAKKIFSLQRKFVCLYVFKVCNFACNAKFALPTMKIRGSKFETDPSEELSSVLGWPQYTNPRSYLIVYPLVSQVRSTETLRS